jgi:hypothetical protein
MSDPQQPHPGQGMPPQGQWGPPQGQGQWGPPQGQQQWGPPPKKRRKRKWLLGGVAVLVVIVLVSVATGSDDEGASTSASSSSSDEGDNAKKKDAEGSGGSGGADTAAAGIGDPVRDGKFEFTVTKVRKGVKKVGSDFASAKAQGQFVLVNVTVENIGDEPQSFSSSEQTMYDAEDREFSADDSASIYIEDSNSLYTEINPGNKVKGVVAFDIPKGAKPTRLELHDSIFSGGVDVSLK